MARKERTQGRATAERAKQAAYSVAAGAAVAAMGGPEASAEVVYGGRIEESIDQFSRLELVVVQDGLPTDNVGVPTDSNADLILKNYVFNGGNYQGVTAPFAPGNLVASAPVFLNYARALSDGYLVDSSSVDSSIFDASLAYGFQNPSAEFNDVVEAFIGFSFGVFPEGSEQADEHYGWVRVSIDNDGGTFVVHDFAYESEAGVGILTGDTGASGVPGDFNNDGSVDAADYTVWRNNEDVPITSGDGTGDPLSGNGDDTGASAGVADLADLLLWEANLGVTADSPAAVPEPVSLGLLAAGGVGVTAMRRRRERRG